MGKDTINESDIIKMLLTNDDFAAVNPDLASRARQMMGAQYTAPARQQTQIARRAQSAPTVAYQIASQQPTRGATMITSALWTIAYNLVIDIVQGALRNRGGYRNRRARQQSAPGMGCMGYGCLFVGAVIVLVIGLVLIGLGTVISQPDQVVTWLIDF